VPRFLSSEWAAAFDAPLDGVTVPGPADDAGLAAADGRFTVVQEVSGGPDGAVTVVLEVADGSMHIRLETATKSGSEDGTRGDVAVSLSYPDAASLARGELAVAEAITGGRIKVRGDLSVLVAAQQMLTAAQPSVQALAGATTF
jgi:putative sterol carrier protein